MATIDNTRNGLIDKILFIRNSESDIIELTKEQKVMLEMSEQDIKKGKLISQEAIDKRNPEWLNAM
ncbi:hypothetical protein [uncultured Algibacter sp.]|uniref:hypothetical protein n=1 Tax=uncultured Algibacter sp. TaxID=298659 RepID=UPI0026241B67|nr:hypothetical protein [uncultured Algibacter sp.]